MSFEKTDTGGETELEIEDPESMEVVRKIVETININRLSKKQTQQILNLLKGIDSKLNLIDQKLNSVLENKSKNENLKKIHRKILDLLDGWMSTRDLSNVLGYRQEYISRKVAELKKLGTIEEKRNGKKIVYKRIRDE